MFRYCNVIVFALNFISFIASIPLIMMGMFLQMTVNETSCGKSISSPYLVVGIILLILSVIGLIGSCCRISVLLWLYLWAIIIIIIGYLGYTMYEMLAIHKGENTVRLIKDQDEYQIEEFSVWLQSYVRDNDSWIPTRNCFSEARICSDLHLKIQENNLTAEDYMKLLPLQWGCCKPPYRCGYEHKNETFWTVPKSGISDLAAKDHDCITYSNHQDTLCFDCDTCKAGYLAFVRRGMHESFFSDIFVIFYLLILFSVTCCAFRSNRNAERYSRYRKDMVKLACEDSNI